MNLSEKKIGVIGAGNMATAIVKGLLGKIAPNQITVSDCSEEKLQQIRQFGVSVSQSNTAAGQFSDVVILAVKPNIYPAVLKELRPFPEKLYLTIAPGMSLAYMQSFFGESVRMIRTMPNMPAQIGKGMTAYACAPSVTDSDKKLGLEILSCLGECTELDETLLNAAVAVNGSAPAYVFIMIEAMADAAVLMGIPREKAYLMAAETVEGSAAMLTETGLHPAQLKDMVCSPGGTTIEAVKVLEEKGFRAALMEAMKQCAEKSEKMGQ